MSQPQQIAADRKPASLLVASLALTGALLAVSPPFIWYGGARSGWVGVGAAALAGCMAWGSSLVALLVTALGQRFQMGIQAALAAMLVRMAAALIALIALPQICGPLVEAGALGMFVGYYLIALVVETLLSLQFVPPNAIKTDKISKTVGAT